MRDKMEENKLRRLHKDVCMAITTYEFEDEHLDFESFKRIVNNYA